MARQTGADGRGAQGQALPQRSGERRIEAKNLIQQSEPGAGAESRVAVGSGADGWLFRRTRPRRKSLFQQRVGRLETRRGEPGAAPSGSAAGISSSKPSVGANRTMALA
jgi:hypothetical protein